MSIRISKSTWPRVAAAACFVLLAPLVGCGDKEPAPGPGEESNFLPRTSPTNLLHNLKQAYAERDIAEYDSLLAEDFTFVLSEEDQVKPDMPDSWPRDTEIQIMTNMFDTELVGTLTLSFEVEDVDWDPILSMYTLLITHVNLFLYGATPGHPTEVREYRISDSRSRFWFRRNPWTTGAAHDSVWTIVRWEDNPVRSWAPQGTSETQTWGALKAIFE